MFISMDPGVDFVGLSVIDHSKGFRVVKTVPVTNKKRFSPEQKEEEKVVGARVVKIRATMEVIDELIKEFNPSRIVIEAPFYSSLSPVAYGSLLEVIFAIKYLITLPQGLPMQLIEPTVVKKVFTGSGIASKTMMRERLSEAVASKLISLDTPVDELSEHQVDSIAIAWATVELEKREG